MHVREFMTTKLITVPSDTPVANVARLLSAHKIRRIPVVDDGKLVGIVGDRMVSAALPSTATTLSSRSMSDTLSKLTVKNIMHRDVITITPETTAETALHMAQENKVGCLVVVENGNHPVGIVTTNDFIYRILNPVLGLKRPGVRLHIHNCAKPGQIKEIAETIEKHKLEIDALHLDDNPEREPTDLIIQLMTKDPHTLIKDLTEKGYKVEIRNRKSYPLTEES